MIKGDYGGEHDMKKFKELKINSLKNVLCPLTDFNVPTNWCKGCTKYRGMNQYKVNRSGEI
jgi:sulfur relay (sulfurtransferase) complex TusBCD TusD component (DsrE family)